MKKLFPFSIILFVVQSSYGQNAAAMADSLVSAYARLHQFNGAVLVAKNGTVLLNKGYGYRNVADKVFNTEQSIFQLGSITKQFTAAVILKLQAEKKLSVTDHLNKFFPDYPKGDSITIEQLLTHTSGIYNYTNNENFMANEIAKATNRDKIMAMFKDKPLDFSPGTSWSYSNSGYSLLGYIIEAVTKQPYEAAVRKYIFTPLQMTHSGFDFTHLKSSDKTTGYFKVTANESTAAPIVDSTVSFSAGAIYSTTGDLYLWHKALENYTILTKQQQEKAFTPVKEHYGFGWFIDSTEGKRRVGHGGGIHGFVTNISRVPADDLCIVLLSNASDGTLNDITKSLFAILYNKEYVLPKEKAHIQLPEASLKQYEGEYEIKPELHVVMTVKDGELVAAPTGQPTNIMFAEKEDAFFLNEPAIQINFTRNDKKEIDGFILHQGGATIPCKKIK